MVSQLPTDVPNPANNTAIDFENPLEVIVYIVIPIALIIMYLYFRNRSRKRKE